jgi:hypothetical protein
VIEGLWVTAGDNGSTTSPLTSTVGSTYISSLIFLFSGILFTSFRLDLKAVRQRRGEGNLNQPLLDQLSGVLRKDVIHTTGNGGKLAQR